MKIGEGGDTGEVLDQGGGIIDIEIFPIYVWQNV
jgi:hypothetical protein